MTTNSANQAKQELQPEMALFSGANVDFGQYFAILKRYALRIFMLGISITILVALLVMSITPLYTANTTLLIEAEQTNVTSIQDVYALDSSKKEYFETQYEILRSRQIATKVVDELALYDNQHFNLTHIESQKGGIASGLESLTKSIKESLPFLPQKREKVLSAEEKFERRRNFAIKLLQKRTTISPIRSTQVVKIIVESPSGSLSAEIANTIAEVYIENYLEAKLVMTEKATEWLNESLQGIRSKLNQAERNLSAFYEQEQLVDIDGVVGLASDEVQQLSDKLIDEQASLQQNQAIYELVTQQDLSLEELSTIPDVFNHPSIQSVKREEVLAESKVSELREVYGPKHPTMIAASAELNSIRSSLKVQVGNLVSGISNEYRTIESKIQSLKADLEIAKSNLRRLASLDNTRKTLQREVDINQQLYDSFFTRLKETDQLGGFESANARVLDAAKAPNKPSKPNKKLMVAASFVLSLIFGAVMSFVVESFNNGVRSVEDVEKQLGQRMLGIIPWQPHKKKEPLSLRHFFDPKHHTFSEALRTLRTSLQLLNIDKPSQTILVTSSVPKEGKSTVSVNLAFAMGQLNKVLLVEADLRRPTIAKRFQLPGFQPGLANAVVGTHELSECIVKDEESGIEVLCAGTIPPNPQELLASQKFADLMDNLKKQYDYVIVDSAPTQAVSDAIVVSKHCDSLVYVVKADSTSIKVINNGLSRFVQIGHRIDGLVLNQVDIKKAQKHGEYSGFYDQYGYNSYNQTDSANS